MSQLQFAKGEFVHAFLFKQRIKTGADITIESVTNLLSSLNMADIPLVKIGLQIVNDVYVQNKVNIQMDLENGIEFIRKFILDEYGVQSGNNYVIAQLIDKINHVYKRPAYETDFQYPEHAFMQIKNLFITGAIDWDNGFIASKDNDYIEKLNKEIEKLNQGKSKMFKEMIEKIAGKDET